MMGRGRGIDNKTLVQKGLPLGADGWSDATAARRASGLRSAPDLPQRRRPFSAITLARCALTVRSAAPRSAAICLLSCPATTASKTCRSRALSELKRARSVASSFAGRSGLRVALDGVLHRGEQGCAVNGLGEEIRGPRLHRAHARGHVGMPGEKNHGQRERRTAQRRLQVQAARPGHADIEDQTAMRVWSRRLEEETPGRCVPESFVARNA